MINIKDCIEHMTKKNNDMASFIQETTEIVNVERLLNDKTLEDYVVIGILFGITHHHKNDDDDNMSKSPYGQRKRPKKNYNRIFYFGGLNGTTFCHISESERSSLILLNILDNEVAVGTPFLIYEPTTKKYNDTLKLNQLEILTKYPFIPMSCEIYNKIPDIQPNPSKQIGEQTMFLLKEQMIRLYRCLLIGVQNAEPPSCQGRLCDRKMITTKTNVSCGCFVKKDTSKPVVLEFSVGDWEVATTHECEIKERSYRTTKLFVRHPDKLGSSKYFIAGGTELQRLRSSIRNTVNKINEDFGGFTIIGTMSRGSLRDISDQTEETPAPHPTTRLCYLMPTNLSCTTNPQLVALKYDLRNIIDVDNETTDVVEGKKQSNDAVTNTTNTELVQQSKKSENENKVKTRSNTK